MIEETKYYYFTPEGEKTGPYTRRELKDMADSGKIPESASVLSCFNSNWHLLVDVLSGNHPFPMSRRRHLGKCPRCGREVHSVADARYGRCPSCRFPLGTPRRVVGITRNFLFTIRKRYFCFRGRAVRAEYWSMVAMAVFCASVLGLFTFACLQLSFDEFNLHQLNGRRIYELAKDSGGFNIALCIFLGLEALVGLFFVAPLCGVAVRRLHDISCSGFWFVPVFLMLLAKAAGVAVISCELNLGPSWEGALAFVSHPGYTVVMVLAAIAVLVLFPLKDSKPGSNKSGPSPKYPYQ